MFFGGGQTLKEKADVLRQQLGLSEGDPLVSVVDKATAELGLSNELEGLNLQQKVDACLSRLGVSDVPAAQAVPLQPAMAVVVTDAVLMGTPVGEHEQIQPVVAIPAVPEAPRSTNRLKLALRDGRGLALHHDSVDATHGRRAFHIRMAGAHEAIEVEFNARGNVAVVSGHHTLGYCLDNWYGRHVEGNRQHFSTWYRSHGSNPALRFTFNNEDGTISPQNARHLALGWGEHSYLVPRGDHRQMQFAVPPGVTIVSGASHTSASQSAGGGLIATKDIEGCWICCCFPFLWWAVFKKEATGEDNIKHSGCLMSPCLMPFEEHRVRNAGTNGFVKADGSDPGNIDLYSSPNCVCNGLSCSMKICP